MMIVDKSSTEGVGMPANIVAEKQVIGVRDIVRRNNETLWWGVVSGPRSAPSEFARIVTTNPLFVFATSKRRARLKLRELAAKKYHLILSETSEDGPMLHDSGPYEVELAEA